MVTIRACGLVMTEAEDVLAKIWCGLEEYEMRSPRVQVRPASGGKMVIRISFKRARDADLLLRVLEPLAARVIREGGDLRLANVARDLDGVHDPGVETESASLS